MVVDSQPDMPSAFTQEQKNRSELRPISNTGSWLGITFLSFFLPPSCPLTQRFLVSAVFHVCESVETGSQKTPQDVFFSFLPQTDTYKLTAGGKVQLNFKTTRKIKCGASFPLQCFCFLSETDRVISRQISRFNRGWRSAPLWS